MFGMLSGELHNDLKGMTATYSPSRNLGFKTPTEEEDLRMSITTNPAIQYFYDIIFLSTDGFSNPGLITIFVTIEYLVEFSDIRALAQN